PVPVTAPRPLPPHSYIRPPASGWIRSCVFLNILHRRLCYAGGSMRIRLALFAALSAASLLWQPTPLLTQPQDGGLTQFRIEVGLTDTSAKDWTGAISVTGGELVSVTGWRFSQQDRASNDGKFQFSLKVGPLEDQLAKRNPW